jgi:protein gp37
VANTKIEWAEKVWNPVVGCTKISPGCQNCYAERMAARLENIAYKTGNQKLHDKYYPTINCNGTWTGKVSLCPDALDEPLRWKKPSRIFVCSMGDLFHEDVPFGFISKVFATMWVAEWHTFLVLTKRPERMREFICEYPPEFIIENEPSKNIWLGVTAENQEQADKRIPILLQIPAAVRFVSVEPMLGPVDLLSNDYLGGCINCEVCLDNPKTCINRAQDRKIDWVICGGESGPGARPMHRDWARELRDQCKAAGVPFLFKQWGEYAPNWLYDDNEKEIPGSIWMDRMGKKKAGRLLDGRIYDECPEVTPYGGDDAGKYKFHKARAQAVRKAINHAKTQEFSDIAIAFEKVSKILAEKMTTKELAWYIEEIKAQEVGG